MNRTYPSRSSWSVCGLVSETCGNFLFSLIFFFHVASILLGLTSVILAKKLIFFHEKVKNLTIKNYIFIFSVIYFWFLYSESEDFEMEISLYDISCCLFCANSSCSLERQRNDWSTQNDDC